jgi:hypothetical protein
MPQPIIRFALDPTGQSPNNLVVNEAHTLDPNLQVRAIAPIYGPFYQNSLVITDLSTNTTLSQSQYSCVELLQDATMKFGQGIYALILITDSTVSNTVSINYQVLGGDYQFSAQAVVSAYETLLQDNRPVDWANVLNKPTTYPPSLHEHLLSDVYGFESIIAALERIRNAIILSDVPTLQAVIDWAWNNWGNLKNIPLTTTDDANAGIPVEKYLTFDILLYILNIYKAGTRINTYLSRQTLKQTYLLNCLVNTYDYPDGTVLYWTIAHNTTTPSDFLSTSGQFTIQKNTGNFYVQVSNNIPTTGQELFRIQIRSQSILGPIIAITDSVLIEYQQKITTITPALLFKTTAYDPIVQIDPATLYYFAQQ